MLMQQDPPRGETVGDAFVLMHAGATVVETGQLAGGWRYLIWVRQKGADQSGVPPLLVADASAFSETEVYGFQLERIEQDDLSQPTADRNTLFDRAGYGSLEQARGAMQGQYIRATQHNPVAMLLALAGHWIATRLAWIRRAAEAVRSHPLATLAVIVVIALMVWFAVAWLFPVYLRYVWLGS